MNRFMHRSLAVLAVCLAAGAVAPTPARAAAPAVTPISTTC